jgi:hypothetical protein
MKQSLQLAPSSVLSLSELFGLGPEPTVQHTGPVSLHIDYAAVPRGSELAVPRPSSLAIGCMHLPTTRGSEHVPCAPCDHCAVKS